MGRKPIIALFGQMKSNPEIFIYIAGELVWDAVPGDRRWYRATERPTDDFLATMEFLDGNPRPDLLLPETVSGT